MKKLDSGARAVGAILLIIVIGIVAIIAGILIF
jgi:hypothetical protein